VVARARAEEPDAVGVFVFGSHVRGEATATSDVDLQVATLARPRVHDRTWFVGDVRYSVAAAAADELRRSQERPVAWAFGFAAESPGLWLWRTAAAVAAVGDPPTLRYPPAQPALEDFVGHAAKALRAEAPLALRLAAQGLGRDAVPLLLDLDAQQVVRTRREAVEAALALRVAPEGWRNDLPVLLGLAPAADESVRAAVERVGFGVLRLLREAGSRVGDAQPELSRYLHDGTLERHLDRSRCYPGIP
jgi:phosphoribosyl-AMP cyclohydrolase